METITPYCFRPVRAFMLQYDGRIVGTAIEVGDGWHVMTEDQLITRSIQLTDDFPVMVVPFVARSLQEATNAALMAQANSCGCITTIT